MSIATELTPRQLHELKSAVSDAASRPEELLDGAELAKVLKVSPSTVERKARAGLIPCLRIGACRRYMLSAVIDALGKS